MQQPLTLGIAGLGTVGAGLLHLLDHNKDRLEERAGRQIRVAGLSARTKDKDRGVAIAGIPWFDDPVKLATDPGIAVFVELIGGAEGVAKDAVEAALRAGKHVVTANKALLAEHGVMLAQLAEKHGVALNFEAAVAGGIPVIKTLRESLALNEIDRVYGILNGTCNFILTAMASEHRSFDDVLKEAQELGYAEADPTFDIGGFDTAHKLAILTSLAFGVKVAPDQIHVEGIQTITEADIEAAEDIGYRIKLLGVATRAESGIEARVNPAMVPKHSAIAEVSGVTNGVAIDADYCSQPAAHRPRSRRAPHRILGRERYPRHRARARHAAVRDADAQPQALQEGEARRASGRLLRAACGLRPAGRHGGDRQAHGRPRGVDREHRAAAPAFGPAGDRGAPETRRTGARYNDHA